MLYCGSTISIMDSYFFYNHRPEANDFKSVRSLDDVVTAVEQLMQRQA